MNISLTQELESFVKTQVASGHYTSASEVIREALRGHIANQQAQGFKQRLENSRAAYTADKFVVADEAYFEAKKTAVLEKNTPKNTA